MLFNEKLKQLRKGANLTQEELGNKVFVSRSTIAKYETGLLYPSQDILIKLASVFNIEPDELMDKDECQDVAIKSTNKLEIIRKVLLIGGIAFYVLLILLLVLPLFTNSYYIYPIKEGQDQPEHVLENVSLLVLCLRHKNISAVITIIVLAINIGLNIFSIFKPKEKVMKIITISLSIISIVLFISTFILGVSYLQMKDY